MAMASMAAGFAQPAPTPAAESDANKLRLASAVFEYSRLEAQEISIGQRREVVNSPTGTLENLKSQIFTLRPKQAATPGLRSLPEDEIIVLLEGSLDVIINGTTRTASAGSMIFFASNAPHQIINNGTKPAVYYAILLTTTKTPPSMKLR